MLVGSISVVSAADLNETSDVVGVDDVVEEISVVEDAEVLSTNYTPQTFEEIQTAVDSSIDGDTIFLDGYYQFSSTVNVDKQLTFVGINDATVDGASSVKLFGVSNNGVIFKNILFKNGYSDHGAAIDGNCTALNCTFINNRAYGSGGAGYNYNTGSIVYSEGDGGAIKYGNAINCTFINNAARTRGGAISNGNAYNCTFLNNTVFGENSMYVYGGGAIYKSNAYNCIFKNNSALAGGAMFDGNAFNSIFIGNSAQFKYANSRYGPGIDTTNIYSGGAMCGGSATNSTFINNSGTYGGAVCKATLKYCNFINNSAEYGGGLYYYESTAISDCAFENNIATRYGNEICISSYSYFVSISNCNFTDCHSNKNSWFLFFNSTNSLNIDGCSFINCSSEGNGGAIYINDGPTTTISNCNFEGNLADNGGAIYYYRSSVSIKDCYFKNNVANYGGAIFYEKEGTVSNCSFENNKANFEGNEIYFKDSKNINLLNCSFINCISDDDKWYVAFKNANSLTLINCNFINCFSNENGGAINLKNGLTYNFVSCYFEGNTARCGGAIYSDGVSFSLKKCKFVDNNADKGGAISLENLLTYNLTECIFDSNNVDAGDGGAIYCFDSSLNIDNCTFTNNYGKNGGALSLDTVFTSNVSNCIFNENRGAYGAAIYSRDSILNVDNCSFMENYAFMAIKHDFYYSVDGIGGAIYSLESEINVNNSVFYHNTGYIQTGAIYGNSFVSNSIFDHNNAMMTTGGMDGGVAVNCTFINNYGGTGAAMATGMAVNCTFIGNMAAYDGGAVSDVEAINCSFIGNHAYNSDSKGGAMNRGSAINCNFVNNTAGYGGAISNSESIINSTFMGNTAGRDAGAIYLSNIDDAEIIGCSFSNCSSKKQGGAIYCSEGTNLNVQKSSFENCSSSEGNNSLVIEGNNSNANIIDCLFDTIPENITSKFSSILIVNDLNIVLGEEGILIANLSDVRGKLVNKTVIFTLNGNNYTNITNSEGLATFNINNYIDAAGSYVINVSFNEDGYELASSTNSNVDIMNYRAILLVNSEGKYYDDISLSFNLINQKDGSPISNASIKVEFDDGSFVYLKSDNNGSAVYKIPFNPGNYTATVSIVDKFVDVDDVTCSFTISKIVGKIAVSQVNNTILNVRVFNPNNGDLYNNMNVSLKFDDGDPVYVVTNKQGVATYNMGFEPGSYSVLAVISKEFTDIGAVLEDVVIKSDDEFYSKITFSSGIVFEYGSSGSIYVTVERGFIEKKNIEVLNHKEAKITFEKNIITISNLVPGKYKLRVTSTPEGDFKPGNATIGITVNKATAVIKATKKTVALKKASYWTIKLINSKTKKPIKNMKLTLKVYTGKKYVKITRTTNSKGEATYKTSGLSKGNHKIVVSAKDKRYIFNTLTSSIKVVKPTPLKFKLVQKVNDDQGSLLSYTVLNKNTGKGINNLKIKCLIYTGKTYKTYILKTKMLKGKKATVNGAVGFSTNAFSAGKHTVKLMPVDDVRYSGSVTNSITITKAAAKRPKRFGNI